MANHRPCPFCGGTHLIATFLFHPHHQCIKCADCGTHGPDAKTRQDAWKAWDRRQSVMATELKSYLGGMSAQQKAQEVRKQVIEAKRKLVEQQRRAEL